MYGAAAAAMMYAMDADTRAWAWLWNRYRAHRREEFWEREKDAPPLPEEEQGICDRSVQTAAEVAARPGVTGNREVNQPTGSAVLLRSVPPTKENPCCDVS